LYALGLTAHAQGEAALALAYHQESLALRQQTGERSGIAECLEALGSLADTAGHPVRAARLLGAADRVRASIGAPLAPMQQPDHARQAAAAEANLGSTAFAAAWAAGRGLPLEEVVSEALSLTAAMLAPARTGTPDPPPGELLTAREPALRQPAHLEQARQPRRSGDHQEQTHGHAPGAGGCKRTHHRPRPDDEEDGR
jgi:hypothetical protein